MGVWCVDIVGDGEIICIIVVIDGLGEYVVWMIVVCGDLICRC